MKVSVVIPAYNEEKYIAKCLQSLLNQQEKPDEIIVVNNNSKDKTVEIAKSYHVRLLHESEQGMIPARNRGFNEALYEVIARTDADSVVPVTWISTIKKNMVDEKVVGISAPTFFYDAPFAKIVTLLQIFIFFKLSKIILRHNVLNGPNIAIRKSAWMKIKNSVCLNDRQVHEDMDLAIHLHKYGTINYVPEMQIDVSARRIKYNFYSIMTDYLFRWIRTMFFQKHFTS